MKQPGTVIKGIQVTEKGTALTATRNQYLFRVDQAANKIDIKRAVEQYYGVRVARVNTMRYEGKLKRSRAWRYGRRPDWKRAIVTLKEGSKIDLT